MTTTKRKRIGRLFDLAEEKQVDITSADEYSESGYSKDSEDYPIVFSNWNDTTANRIGELLEKLGCTLEWSDEWSTCECNKAFRTSADSYSWLPSYSLIGECDLVCRDCIMEDIEGSGYLEELLNNCQKADTFGVDWSQFGFSQPDRERYETGLYPGQDADPEDVASELKTILGHDVDFLFQITGTGQFDMDWIVWVRPQGVEPCIAAA